MIKFNPKDEEHLLGEAIYIAAKVHRYQKDKSGVCYTLHPLAVMLMDGPTIDRDRMIVRVLHDVLEDLSKSPLTLMEQQQVVHHIEKTFPQNILDALTALTHKPKGEETYEEYIERVAASGFLARDGKTADLKHNSDANRLPIQAITEGDLGRWAKYRKALVRLLRED